MGSSFESLIDPGAPLTCLGTGYQFSEGPVWSEAEQCLYFSDIPGDTRWRWTESGGMEVDLFPTFKGNGMAIDMDGSLLVCEQVSSCLVRFKRSGERELVCLPLRREVPEQPERRRRPGSRRQHLLHRSRLRPLERLDRLRAQPRPARLQGSVPCTTGRR